MRLVFVTQRVDPDDPVLGATVGKITALAARLDEVVVLTDGAAPGALPANCRVRPFRAATRAGRGLRFGAALALELARRPRPLAVVAHMCPIYAVLAAPLARPLGVPVLLWFAQWHRSRTLDVAGRAATRIATAAPGSVPLTSAKVTAIGHGIDVTDFPCAPLPAHDGLVALALGRYARSKGLDTIVRAVAAAGARGADVRLRVHGPDDGGDALRRELSALAAELGAADRVSLAGALPRREVPAVLAAVDVLVNATRAGAPDKVVYEAAASCRPALASSPVFADLLGDLPLELAFPDGDHEALGARLATLAAAPPALRSAIGSRLRERVEHDHSVAQWADRLLELCRA